MTSETHRPTVGTHPTFQKDIVTRSGARIALAVGRIVIGWTFLWAFLDKTFGLGFATPAEAAWIRGGTPAQGYLDNAVYGPLTDFFQIFSNPFGDWLFMLGLLGLGVAMILGAGLKIAAVTGTLLLLFMYLSALPFLGEAPGNNPVTDSHWIEAIVLIISAATLAGDTWGIGRWWGGKVGNSWLR